MAFKKRESISVFEIEEGRVRLGLFEIDESGCRLKVLLSAKTTEKGSPGLTKTIKRLAGEYRLSASRVLVNIQRYKVTVKNLKLPSTNPAEIDSMVNLQAAKQLPFPADKIISSYRVMGRDAKGYSDVMMALLHRDFIDRTLNVFTQAGLDVERLTLSSEALNLWYITRQKPEVKKSCVCLIDIDTSSAEIQIIKDGVPELTRAVMFSSDIEMEKGLLDEIKKSFFTFTKGSPGSEIKKLILTGRRSVLNKEAPILKKNLSIPMVFSDPLKQYPKSEDATLPGAESLAIESFSALTATGFYSDRLQFNFIPGEIRNQKASKMLREGLIITVSLSLCIAIGIGGIITKGYIDKKRRLDSIQKKLTEAHPMVEKLAMLKRSTKIIRRQTDLDGSSIDVIRELYSNLPSEITLTIFDYEDGRSCLLRGSSNKLSDVFKFVSILEGSPYFENVKVRYATKRVVAKQELTDFELTCQLAMSKIE